MIVQGVVMSYTPSTKVEKQGGGTYDAWELVYRNNENKVESVVKPVQSLKYNPALKAGLASLNPGEDFTLVMEKENGFWNAKSVEKGKKDVQDVAAAPQKADGNRAPVREGKVAGSNYETPGERAKKQIIVSRLGSVNSAIAFLEATKGKQFTVEDVKEVATQFEAFAFDNLGPEAFKYQEVKTDVPF